jgi:hypothetical protein
VRLEPDEGRLSSPVLRGPGRSNPARLPDLARGYVARRHVCQKERYVWWFRHCQKRGLLATMCRVILRALYSVSLVFTFLLFVVPTMAQRGKEIPVPREVIAELGKDKFIRECFEERGGGAKSLEAEILKLSRGASPDLLVTGKGCLCGASMCPSWLYRRTASGYKMILDAGYILDMKLMKTFTNGYRDLKTVVHDSAFDQYLDLYKFDGKKYRATECFERHYRNRQGGFDGKLQPRTVRVKCDQH